MVRGMNPHFKTSHSHGNTDGDSNNGCIYTRRTYGGYFGIIHSHNMVDGIGWPAGVLVRSLLLLLAFTSKAL